MTGDPQEVGVSLSNRQVENTVVVADGETVVIGGLISDRYEDTVNKVPWLGDIPGLGWLFKTTSKDLTKENLLIFLTPHIMRSAADLERETIRKRAEFWDQSDEALELSEREKREHLKRAPGGGGRRGRVRARGFQEPGAGPARGARQEVSRRADARDRAGGGGRGRGRAPSRGGGGDGAELRSPGGDLPRRVRRHRVAAAS